MWVIPNKQYFNLSQPFTPNHSLLWSVFGPSSGEKLDWAEEDPEAGLKEKKKHFVGTPQGILEQE